MTSKAAGLSDQTGLVRVRCCSECERPVVNGTSWCEPHLRGLEIARLYRARWLRLKLSNGEVVAGDDAWRPWLRAADAEQVTELISLLAEREGRSA